jgi:hypothetical protein
MDKVEVTYPDGKVERYRDGLLHDGPNGEPAVVLADGTIKRYCNGKLHDGLNGEPAIVWPDGSTERYYQDKKIKEGQGETLWTS